MKPLHAGQDRVAGRGTQPGLPALVQERMQLAGLDIADVLRTATTDQCGGHPVCLLVSMLGGPALGEQVGAEVCDVIGQLAQAMHLERIMEACRFPFGPAPQLPLAHEGNLAIPDTERDVMHRAVRPTEPGPPDAGAATSHPAGGGVARGDHRTVDHGSGLLASESYRLVLAGREPRQRARCGGGSGGAVLARCHRRVAVELSAPTLARRREQRAPLALFEQRAVEWQFAVARH
ncbi:MAG: hypothetical protein U1E76_09145 [Planctomycetota bacterium]